MVVSGMGGFFNAGVFTLQTVELGSKQFWNQVGTLHFELFLCTGILLSVEMFGLEKLNEAFGMVEFFRGVANMVHYF